MQSNTSLVVSKKRGSSTHGRVDPGRPADCHCTCTEFQCAEPKLLIVGVCVGFWGEQRAEQRPIYLQEVPISCSMETAWRHFPICAVARVYLLPQRRAKSNSRLTPYCRRCRRGDGHVDVHVSTEVHAERRRAPCTLRLVFPASTRNAWNGTVAFPDVHPLAYHRPTPEAEGRLASFLLRQPPSHIASEPSVLDEPSLLPESVRHGPAHV